MKSAPARSATPVKIDRDSAALARRLKAGDIAVIDHADLPADTARALVRAKPAAILNAARTISGRFPSQGARVIVESGVPLIDDLGPDVMSLNEGNRVSLESGTVLRGEQIIAEGTCQDRESVAAALAAADEGLAVKLAGLTTDAAAFVRRERTLLLADEGIPTVRTAMSGRQVLVVLPTERAAAQLRELRTYIKQVRPIVIGVDSGADTAQQAGFTPAIILGDMSTVSAATLNSGAELVVRELPDGRAPGRDTIDRTGTEYVSFPVSASAEEAALLLAGANGAELVVVAGATTDLVEFLESDGSGAAVVTRAKLAGRVVDASVAARLYRNQISGWYIFWLILAALVALAVAVAVTPAGQSLLATFAPGLTDWLHSIFG